MVSIKKVLNHWLMLPVRLVIQACIFIYRKVYRVVKNRSELDDALDLIIKGDFAVDNPFYDITRKIVQNRLIRAAILEANNNLDRVNTINRAFPKEEFSKLLRALGDGISWNVLEKNIKMAGLMTIRGDSFHKSENYEGALGCYNLAIAYTPTLLNYHLVSAHERRAKVLLVLSDIDGARADTLIANYYRDMDSASGITTRQPQTTPEPKDVDDVETVGRMEYQNNILFKVPGQCHERFPGAGSFLDLVHNEERGKHFIVNRDLQPGTTIIAEQQYVHVLNDGLKWHFDHCHRCSKKIRAGIPCSRCVFATYCSLKCKTEDDIYHKYECPCMPYLHALKASRDQHLCVKAVLRAGPDIMKKLMDRFNKVEKFRDENFGLEKFAFEYDTYAHLLRLTSNLHQADMPILSWFSMSIINILDLKTDFFISHDRVEFKCFVASVLLQHLVCFPLNTTSVNETKLFENSVTMGNPQQHISIAIGVYPTINFLNHGCEPNTIRLQMPNGTTSIVTNRPLKKGEEILHTYGFEYLGDTRESRRKILLERFRFSCDCLPCKLNWPNYKDLSRKLRFFCPNCSITETNSFHRLVLNCVLTPVTDGRKLGECKCCGNMCDLKPLELEAVRHDIKLRVARKLIEFNKPREAIPILIECIEYFHANVCPPCIPMVVSKLVLSQVYNVITATPGKSLQFQLLK